MSNILAMNSLQNNTGISNISGFGGSSAGLSLSAGINIFDKTNLSSNILEQSNSKSLIGGLGNLNSNSLYSINAGFNSGQGMVPGFNASNNQMGSMFGGMMQMMQQQQMIMMMQMMMLMTQMMQGGFGSQQGTNGANSSNTGIPASSGTSTGGTAASGANTTSGAPSTISGQTKGTAKGTGYYPDSSALEGGYVDKKGAKLCTLQDFLAGKAPYVSIALDNNLYKSGQVKYGDTFRIPELEQKYGKQIIFKAVDTGGAFTGKGFGRVDICTAS